MPDLPPVHFAVLDAALARADPPRFARLLAQFAAGYRGHFAADEAEATEGWAARVAGGAPPQPLLRIAVAVEPAGGGEAVIGGAAAEYYRGAACALVTYLFVADAGAHRHRGHARALVTQACAACAALGPVRAVLAETEWPDLLPPSRFGAAAVATARARLGFFARVGARIVNVDYVQPALGPGQQPAPYLKLLAFPPAAGRPPVDDATLRGVLDAFLVEFFAALAAQSGGRVDAPALAALRQQVRAAQPLTSPLC